MMNRLTASVTRRKKVWIWLAGSLVIIWAAAFWTGTGVDVYTFQEGLPGVRHTVGISLFLESRIFPDYHFIQADIGKYNGVAWMREDTAEWWVGNPNLP